MRTAELRSIIPDVCGFYILAYESAPVKRLVATVSYPVDLRHPLHQGLIEDSGDATEVALLTWGPVGDVSSLIWIDAPPSTSSRLFEAATSMQDYHLLPTAEGTYAVVHQQSYDFPDEVLEVTERAQTVFLPPLTFQADGDIETVVVGSATGLSRFVEDLEALARVDIQSVQPFRRDGPTPELTDRQETVLAVADRLGYYAIPREASVTDVADELACASSTAGEILRRAERSLVSTHIEAGH